MIRRPPRSTLRWSSAASDVYKRQVPESDWNNDALYEKLNAYIEEQGIKKGLAMWVLRIAAAGQKVTPGGATEILSLLGKKISMERIKKSLAKLQEL